MSRRSLAALEKRLRKREARRNRDVSTVGVLDLPARDEADRVASDAAEDWEARADIDVVERAQGERPVLHADHGVALIEVRSAPEPGVARWRRGAGSGASTSPVATSRRRWSANVGEGVGRADTGWTTSHQGEGRTVTDPAATTATRARAIGRPIGDSSGDRAPTGGPSAPWVAPAC